jgi:hypothetical protein
MIHGVPGDDDYVVSLRKPPSMKGAFGSAFRGSATRSGALLLHGAAFRLRQFSVLAFGTSGAGKSTLCAAALSEGGRLISDDSVLVCPAPENGRFSIHAMRADAYFSQDTRNLLPAYLMDALELFTARRNPKLRLPRYRAPDGFLGRTTPSVILSLNGDSRPIHTSITRIDQAAALAAIIASSTFPIFASVGGAAATRLQLAKTLALSLPAFEVQIGTQLMTQKSGEIQRLLELLSAALQAGTT